MLILLSVLAAVLCLSIVGLLVYEDVEARRELRRGAYRPRHALKGEDTIRLPVGQFRAVAADRIEVPS